MPMMANAAATPSTILFLNVFPPAGVSQLPVERGSTQIGLTFLADAEALIRPSCLFGIATGNAVDPFAHPVRGLAESPGLPFQGRHRVEPRVVTLHAPRRQLLVLLGERGHQVDLAPRFALDLALRCTPHVYLDLVVTHGRDGRRSRGASLLMGVNLRVKSPSISRIPNTKGWCRGRDSNPYKVALTSPSS